ncbi:thioredoxin family protein [Kitasatospora sp. NPDC057198]|uniref:thioredoxin family protein n=1 Tax=Kitasatospora sp. NPDC057198 TaxID=3346046 RepID=UPI003642FC1F
MRRIRLGMTAAIAGVALTAGCASSAGTTAATPAATAATAATAQASVAAAVTSPAAVASPSSPLPVASPTAARGIPDGYDAGRDAEADIRAALAEAAKDHREVLVDFGADWCPDCRALDVMFRSAQVEPLLQKDYVVVAVDVGRFDHNLDVAAQYVDLQTSGIPALAVLKSNGELRTATDDGAFANASSMDAGQVSAFLTRWAPAGDQ